MDILLIAFDCFRYGEIRINISEIQNEYLAEKKAETKYKL